MEEAADGPRVGGPELEPPEGPAGRGELSPRAPGETPGAEELDGSGEPADPRPEVPAGPGPEEPPGSEELEPREAEEPGPEKPEPSELEPGEAEEPGPEKPEPSELEPGEAEEPGPEKPEPSELEPGEAEEPGPEKPEPSELEPGVAEESGPEKPSELEPCEPEEPEPEEMEPQGLSEPSEPEVAAGPPGPSVAAPAAGGAGEEEAPPVPRADEAPAAPRGAEQGSGEAADEAPEERDAAAEGEEEHREQHCGLAGERERPLLASARPQMRLGEGRRRAEPGAGGPELYGQELRLPALEEQRELEAAAFRELVMALQRDGEERQARAQAEWAAFQARKKAVAVLSLGRWLGGRQAAEAAVDAIQAGEWEKERRVREARMENIKLKYEIQNLETILKARGERVEGQHVTEFEHMKKENQKHNKKISYLTDEILKLKKKISNTVHVLSQFREKLQFVEAENQARRAELMDIESILSQKRNALSKTRQARDKLRRNNLKLQEQCRLLGNEPLLRDFEEKMDTVELLSQRLEALKHHHAGLILSYRGIQKKIKEANSSFPAEDD